MSPRGRTSKRGSHLALTLERLEALVRAESPDRAEDSAFQRIGLSATRTLWRRSAAPGRTAAEVTIVDAGAKAA